MCRIHKYFVWIYAFLFSLSISDKVNSCQIGSYQFFDKSCKRFTYCGNYWEGIKDDIVYPEKGKCETLCKKGTYAFNGTCEKECPFSLNIFDDAICVSDCPDRTFRPRNKPRHCYYCHPECDGCFGKTELECNKCQHKQYNGRCVPNCPTDTFEDSGKCVDSCPEFSHAEKCVDQCPDGFYPTRDLAGFGICSPCHPQCKTCNGPRDSDCFICINKKYEDKCIPFCKLPKPVYFNGTCYAVCPWVIDNQTCIAKCPQGKNQLEQECVSQCPDNFNTIDGKCTRNCTEYVLDGKCVKKCPKFHLTDVENKMCVQSCPEAYPFIDNTICTDKCLRVHYNSVCYEKCPNEFPTVDQQCVIECPMTHPYLDPQKEECTKTCNNLTLKNQCVEKCPQGFIERNGTCIPRCPPSLFDFKGTCIDKCPEKILLSNQQCVSACPNGTYTDKDICQQCHSECSNLGFCSGAGADQCETCRHYKHDSKCVSACSSKDVIIDRTKECVKKCPKDMPFVKENENICMASCPSGYGEISGQKKCTNNCSSHGLSQTPQNNCVQECPDEYPFSYGSNCLAECPFGLVMTHNNYGVKICAKTCSDFYLQTPKSECVTDCPQEYPWLLETRNCVQECPYGSLRSVDSRDIKRCVETCSSPAEFLTSKNECVKECPHEYPWLLKENGTKICGNTCPIGMYVFKGECVQNCPNGTFLIFDTYCSMKSFEKCDYYITLDVFKNPCPEGVIDACTGTCMSQCPNGTSTLRFYLNFLHLRVCLKVTYKFGPLILVISSFVYITAAVYVLRKYWRIRQKYPLRNPKNVRKLLLEDAVTND